MDVMEFKNKILNQSLDNYYIMTGDEALISIYLEELLIKFKVKFLNSIDNYISITSSKLKDNYNLYIIKEDTLFKEDNKYWSLDLNNVVFIYNNLDKREKFYKYFENNIIYFDKLADNLLHGIIANRVNIAKEDINWIIQKCNSNYFLCLNEINKISCFDKKEHQNLFNIFKKEEIICKKDKVDNFEFSNALLDKNKTLSFELVDKISPDDIIGQLNLIYTNFKNLLLVKGGNEPAEKLNMNPKLYYILSKKNSYSTQDICNILLCINSLLYKIKLGKITVIEAINLLLLRCLK